MSKYNYIYGVNPIIECIKAGKYKISNVYLMNANNKKLVKLLKRHNIKYVIKNKLELDRLFNGKNHQGVVAQISDWKTETIENLAMQAKKEHKNPLIVMLDQIEDPHNFGAIMRSCDLFNVAGIVILNVRQAQLNPTVAKVSTGAFNYVPVCVVNNLSNALRYLKDNGFWVYATSFSPKSKSFDQLEYDSPTVLILGNEGKGISAKLLTESDFEIHIPTDGNIDSLNVSCAAAILVYEIAKQLK